MIYLIQMRIAINAVYHYNKLCLRDFQLKKYPKFLVVRASGPLIIQGGTRCPSHKIG